MNKEDLRDIWVAFKRENACSIDRMLCNDELRESFLEDARNVLGDIPDNEILWALVGLRKRKMLRS